MRDGDGGEAEKKFFFFLFLLMVVVGAMVYITSVRRIHQLTNELAEANRALEAAYVSRRKRGVEFQNG